MDFFDRIDWELLRSQKSKLLQQTLDAELDDVHEGIVNLIDSLQDFAVDKLGYPSCEIFGEGEDE